ncbi:spermidine/putrescine ABC transporter permease PotC [Paraferrimonas haliotis]|uniref:Spermidine/putrescine transport system permease protein PotC n=1 Tax=Paraferrimonas haliotis TaxID=2013866 RepID=A0AA37TYF4_9GAMM|nr:spermidine/putrescine ABC transporter permease PotC [Paraferrimonas haliotis]GLS84565.1 spermidine/putrescine ABC transporter permease PotC [Paraferrimonas haliotis]
MAKLSRAFYLFILFLFLYLPIFVLVGNSFNQHKFGIKWRGFTTQWYDTLFNNAALMDAAINSLTIGLLAATISTIIGTLTSVALFRYRFRGKKLLSGSLFVVMSSPDIILAISLLALFIAAGISLGFVSLLLAHITFCLPFVVISVSARLSDFDPKMIESAKDLGANEWQIFSQILMPLALPAVAAGWLLSFTLSLDDVIVSTFVTGPSYEILPIKIYSMVKVGVSPEVNALATVMLVLSLTLVLFSQLILRVKRPTTTLSNGK